jgi:hypothetical protein
MTLPSEFEYAWPAGEDQVWCIHKIGVVGRVLCGRRLGVVPRIQPSAPSRVHRECLDVMYRLPGRGVGSVQAEYGTCPWCEGDVPLVEGRLKPHGEWRVGRLGPVVSSVPCAGGGQWPVQT